MAILFSRSVVVPIWLLVVCLVVVFSPPTRGDIGLMLLIGGALLAPELIAFLSAGLPYLYRKRSPSTLERR